MSSTVIDPGKYTSVKLDHLADIISEAEAFKSVCGARFANRMAVGAKWVHDRSSGAFDAAALLRKARSGVEAAAPISFGRDGVAKAAPDPFEGIDPAPYFKQTGPNTYVFDIVQLIQDLQAAGRMPTSAVYR